VNVTGTPAQVGLVPAVIAIETAGVTDGITATAADAVALEHPFTVIVSS
jgi:hypothetical protein